MKTLLKLLTVLFILHAISCDKENNPPNEGSYKFTNDEAFIDGVVNSIILPEVAKFKVETTRFKEFVSEFLSTPNTETLNALQAQWLLVAKQYARNYVFNIGDIKNKYYSIRLNNWPTTNESIENYLTNRSVNVETLSKLGSSSKGIPALGYLLFAFDEATTLDQFTNPKRKAFLKLVANELETNAQKQDTDWKTYAPQFISSSKTGIDGSFNILFNGLNNTLHYAWETKIGKPAGLVNSPAVNSNKLEAPFSKASLALIRENIQTVYRIFFNDVIISVADKIDYVTKNDELTNTIKQQFNLVNKALDAFESPLFDAVTNDKVLVQNLHDELKRLEVLFTTDVQSALSIIITGTDGDGD